MSRTNAVTQSQSQSKFRGMKSRQQKQRLQRACGLLCLGILVVWFFVWLLTSRGASGAGSSDASQWAVGSAWLGGLFSFGQWSGGRGGASTTSQSTSLNFYAGADERWVPRDADIVHYLEIGTIQSKPSKVAALDLTIESSQFIKAVLDPIYKKIVRGHHMSAPCDGGNPECPAFGLCLNKGACFTTALCEVRGLIEAYHFLVPPKNWGSRKYVNADNQVTPFEGNVFVLENVFFNAFGQVFNATHEFYFGGCHPNHKEPPTYDERYEVTHYAIATTLLSWRGGSYYHAIVEGLAQLLLLEPILRKYPELPVILEAGQKADASLFAEAGWPLNSLTSVWLDKGVQRLVFAERAILPARFYCEQPTKAVLQRIKTQMLKTPPHRQLPSDFDPKDTLWELVATDDWSIGVSFRPESKTSASHQALVKELETRYGSDRVEVVYGVQPLSEVRRIFKESILLLGEHQEGLTNMLFMPPGAVLVEILPKASSSQLYRYLADRLLLKYYIVSGLEAVKGSDAPIPFDVNEVVDLTTDILPPALMPSRVRQTVLEDDPVLQKKAAALMAAVKDKGGEDTEGGGDEESELTDVVPFSSLLSLPRAHRSLAHAIDLATLAPVALHSTYKFNPTTALAAPCDVVKGGVPACPSLARCANAEASVAVGQCQVAGIRDGMKLGTKAVNAAKDEMGGTESMKAYEGNIFVLEDVYLNAFGVAFNATHVFAAGGCLQGYPTPSYTAQAKVTEFGVLASAVSVHGGLFASWVLESLPSLFLLDPFLQQYPHLPLAMETWQRKETALAQSIGYPLDKFRVQFLSRSRDELLFTKKLLLPARPLCNRPTTSLLLGLRTKFFGVTYPTEKPAGRLWRRAKATEWTIAVLCRPESNVQDALVKTLAHTYGAEHVVDLHPLLSEPETTAVARWRSVLAKAFLLIGETQESLMNMLYMAPGTALLEIRPSAYPNRGYHYVADRLSMEYYLIVAEGGKDGPLKTDVKAVVKQVRSILPQASMSGS